MQSADLYTLHQNGKHEGYEYMMILHQMVTRMNHILVRTAPVLTTADMWAIPKHEGYLWLYSYHTKWGWWQLTRGEPHPVQ